MIVIIKNLKDWERGDILTICHEHGLKCFRLSTNRIRIYFNGLPPETIITVLGKLPQDITSNGMIFEDDKGKHPVDFEILPPLECFRVFMHVMAREHDLTKVLVLNFSLSDACKVYKILLMRGVM